MICNGFLLLTFLVPGDEMLVARDEGIAGGPAVALTQWKILYFQNPRNNAEQLLKHIEDFILALMWGYCMSVPFSNGCYSQPSCVKIAKHYSELMSQIILSSDNDLVRFSVNKKNIPQIAIKEPLPSVATEEVTE